MKFPQEFRRLCSLSSGVKLPSGVRLFSPPQPLQLVLSHTAPLYGGICV